ncbi:Predicted oxidoreductase [Actinacidiphila yanglinensis]|uniref:Predicted oxidoreductase n=1 Tax=Actinacidiphila yanglinensis TaxID=310779 RepID=A0A1H6D2D1_9ACTN|nr:aldo/keto reductase [Actinacidiphila yanglinensis]SEG79519.1 Predicted oxidoreductase [Actinacidiphila yanglinensis]
MTTPASTPQASGATTTLAGRPVARVGLGAMQLTGGHGLAGADPDRAAAVLRTAVEHGVNHIDTAQFYNAGRCNQLIRDTLAPYPDDLVLVTKIGAEHDDRAGLVAAQRPEQLRAGVEANLTGLGIDRIDVVNLRRVDSPPGIIAEGDQVVDLDSQLAELAALRDEGKIAGIGLSNVSADQLRQALPAGIACVQNSYSLLDRTSEPVLDLCRTHSIPWVPFCPLGSAFPNNPKVTAHPTVIHTATTLSTTPAQVGLAWLLATYPHTLLIPGTTNPSHLLDNLAAATLHLPAETLTTLTTLT